MINNKFSKNLRLFRKIAGLSQDELSKIINTTKSTISNYENDYSEPNIDTLIVLSKVLQVSIDVLVGNSVSNDDIDLLVEERVKEIIKRAYDDLK